MPTRLPAEFEAYLTYLERNQRKAANTVRAYRKYLAHLVIWCGFNGVDPRRPTPEDLARCQQAMAVTLSPASQACYTSGIRCAYRWCHSPELTCTCCDFDTDNSGEY